MTAKYLVQSTITSKRASLWQSFGVSGEEVEAKLCAEEEKRAESCIIRSR